MYLFPLTAWPSFLVDVALVAVWGGGISQGPAVQCQGPLSQGGHISQGSAVQRQEPPSQGGHISQGSAVQCQGSH